jgi:prophage maintenance system killer protein
MAEDQEKPEIAVYRTADGQTTLNVEVAQDTVWLTAVQMGELFQTTRQNIGLHIRHVFSEAELERTTNVRETSVVQQEGKRTITRNIEFYSLDVIISVGYRVKSKQGTNFRIWANRILKQFLLGNYVPKARGAREKAEPFQALKNAVALINNVTQAQSLSGDQATGLLRVLTDYTYALDVLDKYDHQVLEVEATSPAQLFQITYGSAMEAIRGLRDRFGGSALFGNEKDESFRGSLATIYQTFGSMDLYPSVEEKAANLLYFVIKNHSFSDGNKRIAAFLFVWFLEKNGILYRADGTRRLADNALVALTLMIAESKPAEKEMMTKVVVSLINAHN